MNGEKLTGIFEDNGGLLQVLWFFSWPPARKGIMYYRQITVLCGPSAPHKLLVCCEQRWGTSPSHSFKDTREPFCGRHKWWWWEGRKLLCYYAMSIATTARFPDFPDSFTQSHGLLKCQRPRFSGQQLLQYCLLMGLCSWDSHILTVTSARRLSALLCPALVINIFPSTQHGVHFAAYRTWNTNDLHLNGQLRQTAWQTGCGWTFLDFLTPWHLCLGCTHVGNDTESLLGKN